MKTLKDIVTEVQEVTGLSKSELSRRIGKSRNYLVSVVKAGLTYESEKALIQKLHSVAEQEYDDFEKLRQNLEIAEEKIIERNEDFRKLSKKYKDSEHKVVMLQKQIDRLKEIDKRLNLSKIVNDNNASIIGNLRERLETKDTIISDLNYSVDTYKQEIKTLRSELEHGSNLYHETVEKFKQERIENKFLTVMIVFVFIVFIICVGINKYG